MITIVSSYLSLDTIKDCDSKKSFFYKIVLYFDIGSFACPGQTTAYDCALNPTTKQQKYKIQSLHYSSSTKFAFLCE
jgi:hypothetical protein